MKKALSLLSFLVVASCSPTYHNNIDLDKNKDFDLSSLKNTGDAIIIFHDNIGGIELKNITTEGEDVYVESGLGLDLSTPTKVVTAKPGRYVFAEGIFNKSIVRMCPSTLAFGTLIPAILASQGKWVMQPEIDNKEAIMYLDIKAGGVYYVGYFDSKFAGCKIVLNDSFEDAKKDINKKIPTIADAMGNDLMKIVEKPEECKNVIKDNFRMMKNNQTDTKKKNQDYKNCLIRLARL